MLQTITLHPSRIGCPSIPGTMKGIVSSIEGVREVNVRYADRSLDVTFDSALVTPEDVIKKIGSELGLALVIGEAGGTYTRSPSESCPTEGKQVETK